MSDRSRSRSPAKEVEAEAPADTVNLYVGNLDYNTTEDDIREAFSPFGNIIKIFMPTDRETGRPRGFGFVEYDNRKDAEAAIAKMDSATLGSRNLRVNESKPRVERPAGGGFNGAGGGGFNASGSADVKLYVGNLSYNTTEESLRESFAQSGEVTDCSLVTDRETGRPRGFGFITMPSADAQKAIQALNGQELDGRTLTVNEAQPPGGRGRGGRGGGRGGYRGGRGY
eukprot:308387_1